MMSADYFKKGKYCNPVQAARHILKGQAISGPGLQQVLDLSFTYTYNFSYGVF